MLGDNSVIRGVFTLAILLNIFISPWWLTVVWCLAGIILLPLYLEAVIFIVLLESVFSLGGIPMLVTLAATAVVLVNVVLYYTDFYVDVS